MLTGSVLHYVDINTFEEISSLEFMAGSVEELTIRLKQPLSKLRFIPVVGATLILKLPKKDGTILEKTATAQSDDRSIWSAELTALETKDLAGGNLLFQLTNGSKVIGGLIENGLSLIVTGGC